MAQIMDNGELRDATPEEEAEIAARSAVVVQPMRRITKLAFRNRFTQTEKVMLELAALDDPAATAAARQQAASLRVNMKDMEVASYIDLDRADTRASVQNLESAGLIGVGRALEILDAAIQPNEAYMG